MAYFATSEKKSITEVKKPNVFLWNTAGHLRTLCLKLSGSEICVAEDVKCVFSEFRGHIATFLSIFARDPG